MLNKLRFRRPGIFKPSCRFCSDLVLTISGRKQGAGSGIAWYSGTYQEMQPISRPAFPSAINSLSLPLLYSLHLPNKAAELHFPSMENMGATGWAIQCYRACLCCLSGLSWSTKGGLAFCQLDCFILFQWLSWMPCCGLASEGVCKLATS